MTWPDLSTEQHWWDEGATCVVGIDEVGKGSWVGPLTLAAVVLRRGASIDGLRDSKQLSAKRRAELYAERASWSEHVGVGHASPQECDQLGMSGAQRLAAKRALDDLGVKPDRVLVDGRWDFLRNGITTTIIKGDQSVASIAAASIVAKVVRDQL
ncbi:MAG: ribonuclease HII, partial [Acidimicrobiales bacterium]